MKVREFLKLSGQEKADYIVDSRNYQGCGDGVFFSIYNDKYIYIITVQFNNKNIGHLAKKWGFTVENLEELHRYYYNREYDIDKYFITENNDYINERINYILEYEHEEKEEGVLYV